MPWCSQETDAQDSRLLKELWLRACPDQHQVVVHGVTSRTLAHKLLGLRGAGQTKRGSKS